MVERVASRSEQAPGILGVLDTGYRLHLADARGQTLCSKRLDPRDLYQQGGREAWEQRPVPRCQICERRAP